jgi:Cation transport ATPase (P-type)
MFSHFHLKILWGKGCCHWWNKTARRVATLEFDRTRKSMGVIVKSEAGSNSLLVKVDDTKTVRKHSGIAIVHYNFVALPCMYAFKLGII